MTTLTRHDANLSGSGRTKLVIFAVLVLAGVVVVVALELWGREWALALYQPVLERNVTAQLDQQRFGDAEVALLTALRSSPEYAPVILDIASDYLLVMPELGAALEQALQSAYETQPDSEETAINLAGVRFARTEFNAVLSIGPPSGMGPLGEARWGYLFKACRRRMALPPDGSNAVVASVISVDRNDVIPRQLRTDLGPYLTLRQTLLSDTQLRGSPHGQYLALVVETELAGNYEAQGVGATGPWLEADHADAAYRLGQAADAQGRFDAARQLYREAITVSDSHRDAAMAYLRDAKRE